MGGLTRGLTIVILLSILIGIGIFLVDRRLNQANNLQLPQAIQGISNIGTSQLSTTPTPKPTPPPIGPDSNLEEELDRLTPADFSAEFEHLRQQL